MNLFVWDGLCRKELLSFILRRPYNELLEPAVLRGYTRGVVSTQLLFDNKDQSIEGGVARNLSSLDFINLDSFHGVIAQLHKRVVLPVEILHFGKQEQISTCVYLAGDHFNKIAGVNLYDPSHYSK